MRVLVFACLFSSLSFAESISGTVNDPFGHPFAVATVQAKNTSTGAVYKGSTKPSGEFVIADVPPGSYDVSTNVPAVKAWERKGLAVEAGKSAMLKIKLEEGTQLSTLGEDPLGAIADARRHAPPSGSTPRTVDGKVDFSGVWWRPSDIDAGKPEWLPAAQDVAKQRMADNSKESPQAMCLPSPITRWGPLVEFAQTRNFVVVVNDDESPGFHQFYLDGRAHPRELDTDLWYGDSVAHWDGDTLVVDRAGFNPRVWLDQAAHPHCRPKDKLAV